MAQQQPDGRVSHPFEPLLLALTLLVIPVVLVEESSAPHGVKVAAYVANWVIWLGFLVEVVAVLVVGSAKITTALCRPVSVSRGRPRTRKATTSRVASRYSAGRSVVSTRVARR